ncbi:MAG TPA: FecR family protein [Pyrinomonadaceae bacterium]|jgi:FecR protein|nr:FecR family protein [Pyrinomonadaceae bacterium]
MRKTSSLLIFSIALILCCSFLGLAQNREKFVISAKAGGINAVTGQASVHSKGESDWQQLMITDDLESGDRVRTAYDGRVEVLLNPGSYLRIGGDSEVELSDNSLSNLEVKLLRGTAIVEATGADGLELNIGISTPHTRLAIVRQGLYRLNVVPGDATELIVRKGRVILSDSHTKVKGGNKVVFSATAVSVAKLTKEEKKLKEKEAVDVWSKERAETLAQANGRINNRMLNTAFASYRDWDPFGNSQLGVWFFSSKLGCYTFLPFYYGLGSPYGSFYSTSIYFPGAVYYPRQSTNNNWPAPNGSTNTPGPSGSPASAPSAPSTSMPPPNGGFQREPRMINSDRGGQVPRKIDQP